MKDYFNGTSVNRITLERKDFRSVKRVDAHFINNIIDAEVAHDIAKNELVYSLKAFIYGKTHPVQHVVSVPADWVEALKNRFAPLWYLKRNPVKMRHFEASLTELFPTLTPTMEGHPPVMQFAVYETKPTFVYENENR